MSFPVGVILSYRLPKINTDVLLSLGKLKNLRVFIQDKSVKLFLTTSCYKLSIGVQSNILAAS